MHFKRRERRQGGIKGCCAMCASRGHDGGLRNKRIPTAQERAAELNQREQSQPYS